MTDEKLQEGCVICNEPVEDPTGNLCEYCAKEMGGI